MKLAILNYLVGKLRGAKGLEIAFAIKVDIGLLYPMLHDLEKEDLISSYYDNYPDPVRGGARARYYKITEKGAAVFSDQINTTDTDFSGCPSMSIS